MNKSKNRLSGELINKYLNISVSISLNVQEILNKLWNGNFDCKPFFTTFHIGFWEKSRMIHLCKKRRSLLRYGNYVSFYVLDEAHWYKQDLDIFDC